MKNPRRTGGVHCSWPLHAGTGRRVIRRLAAHPGLPQSMPADQRAPDRQEGLANVGPLVVRHAQAAELAQPGERALHHPAPLLQATALSGIVKTLAVCSDAAMSQPPTAPTLSLPS